MLRKRKENFSQVIDGGIVGARQLFWGDVHSTRTHFRSLYAYLSKDVALNSDTGRLDSLPAPSRAALLSVVAAFLPYYAQPQVINHSGAALLPYYP